MDPRNELAELMQISIDYIISTIPVTSRRVRLANGSGGKQPRIDSPDRELRGGGKWAPRLLEDVKDDDDDEQEDASPPPPPGPQGRGKGAWDLMRANPEPPRPKKPHSSKPERVLKMQEYVMQMIASYPMPNSLIVLSRDEYIATVAKIRKNIDAIPLDSIYPELQMVRNHSFTPPVGEYRCRLPKLSVKSTKICLRGEETRCKACDGLKTDWFVGNLTCRRSKFHPECAAVIVRAVGRQRFFDCMGRMSRYDETKNKPREPDKVVECHRDKWTNCPELMATIEQARRLFSQNTDC